MAFIQTLNGELDLMQINTAENRKRYLPLLLKGKAAYHAEALRSAPDWDTVEEMFLHEFTIDPNVIIGELRALRCVDYDVNKYKEQFNAKETKLGQSDPGTQA